MPLTQSRNLAESTDIAIVGRSCRLPGAKSTDALWSLLVEGRCAVTSIPPDRWMLDRNFHPRLAERGKTYTWAAGVLDDIWSFDPGVFGISPREAEQMDPQQRLLLELTWEAFEDAGIRPSKIAGTETGVFIGASGVDHATLRMFDMSSADAYMMTGNTLSIISNRLSYIFDLHGPSFTVDTACSSALVAVNEAVVSLRTGRIDTAVVGGVGILGAPQSFVGFSQAVMLSRRGLCQAFSADADGYVRAEGAVVLVLKTREAAERDGDYIHAVITGSDVNSDGRTNGISLPSRSLQARLLERLYLDGGVDLDALAFVEAHGTGTPVGDPIEAAAIGETIGRRRSEPLLIGSVKTNIGHMEAAAGLGGLLKAMLALEHDQLPASLHSATLNEHIDFEALNLKVARELTPLARRDGDRRLAGVNSFGFGGTNAHVIIADAPRRSSSAVTEATPGYLVLSAQSRAALAALATDYAARLESVDEAGAVALVSATNRRRDRLTQRIVVPVDDRTKMVAALDQLGDEDEEAAGAARGTAIERDAPVAFVFSGNGSQFAGMGLAAYAHSQVFRDRLDAISAAFSTLAGWSIVEALHDPDLAVRLGQTQIAQPLLFAIQSAVCLTLRHHGLEPACVLGHSVGEVAAAEAAGILDASGALETIFARSLHQELTYGHGAMAVVIGSREAAEAILADLPGLEIAAYNSPRAFTVSGPRAAIDDLSEVARAHKARVRKLDLAYPFHSVAMAPVEQPLLHSLAALRHAPSRLPFLSTVTGAALEGDELDAAYWWRNVREPVRFSEAVSAAKDMGARIFVEIGPVATLLSHVSDTIDERTATIATIAALEKRDKGVDPLRMTVAAAIARGAAVDEARVYGTGPPSGIRADLPHYPWQRKVFRLGETSESLGTFKVSEWHPLIGARSAQDHLEWRAILDTSLYPSLADHCVDGRAILPGAAFAEMALAVARDWLGTAEVTVCDIEITSPLQLAPDTSREVACRLSPFANHLEIVSRPRMSTSPWQTHVTAKIVRDAKVGTLPTLGDHVVVAPAHSVTGAEIYAMAERAGLQYGPTFRKLARASTVRPDRIILDLTNEEADPAFGIDPARLDSCFHALVLVFQSLRDAVHGTAYIPVRFGEIMLRQPGVTFTRARIDVLRRDERIIVANFMLIDAAGELVAFMREARFQAIRTSRASDTVSQMIYQTSILASEPTASRNAPALSLAALRGGVVAAKPSQTMSEDYVLLEGWATSLALRTAHHLATANFIDVDALVRTGRLPERLRPWLDDMLVSLERSGLCHKDRLGRHIDPDVELPEPDEILRTIAHEHQARSSELLVASSALKAVEAIVAGEAAGLANPLTSKVLDGFEIGSVEAHAAAAYLRDLLVASMRHWPKDRATRILQIGSGPLTTLALSAIAGAEARLTVLDSDRRRLERARMGLAERSDVAFVEKMEDLPPAGFDVLVAANTLHRRVGMPGMWSGLRRVMAPGAIFVAVEPLPSFFREFVCGLAGCLDADEGASFHGHSFGETDWLESMQSAGLSEADVAHVDTAAGTALLLTAQVDAERRRRKGAGTAVIVGDDEATGAQTGSAFATLLASAGLHVSLVLDSDLDLAHLAESPSIVVLFASDDDQHVAPAKRLLDRCMRLKRLVDSLGGRPAQVWLVSSGTGAASDGDSDMMPGFWAFSRTIANEIPSLDIRRVDVAADVRPEVLAERLRDLVLSETDETDIVLGSKATRVVRFEMALLHGRGRGDRATAARLKRGDGSGIDRIHWEAAERQAPVPTDVEIAVEAIGLNFRDVMFGLGLLPEDILEHGFAGPTLGLECAGRVERVGAAVKGFKRGDRVMAFAKNAFSTHVTTPAAVVASVAGDMPFEAAATIPVAFLTAYYALMICARLKPGEWVLIHGGAGGVGLAAIQIAKWRGARILATAGSPDRRALLRSLGAEDAFDSRSGAFVEDVRRVTGEGVAVVLNSLAGEAMERSISILRPFGRFVELGKRDYVANTHIGLRPFRRNLSYFGVDLDQLLIDEPATSKLLMRSVMRLFANGQLAPLPYRTFDASDTVEAFRLMQQSGHVGKLVVRPPNVADIAVRKRHSLQISADKTHLVTGGLGGFGLATAQWLAARGARHLMLVGRTGAATDQAREAVAALTAQGVRVRTEAIDVADKGALRTLFARFGRELPPLGGVIHAAMVLDDALLANLTAEKVERVLRPKVVGASNLDELTRKLPLDYFVLYSSATTLLGNPGQAAYVAANGYLEGLARRRRRDGLPALAVAWGAIEDVGVLARAEATRELLATRAGVKAMLAQDALQLLGNAMAEPGSSPDDAVVTIAPMNWGAARKHLPILKSPTYDNLTSRDEAVAGDAKMDIAALVANSTPEEARKRISGLIVDEIARVLRLPREDVARTTPLSEIGLDSLMAVELALGLEDRFTLNAPLSTSASTFTVNELADHIIGLATGTLSGDDALAQTMIERHLGSSAAAAATDTTNVIRVNSQKVTNLLDR